MCYLTEHADSIRKEEEDEEPHLWSNQKEAPKTHFTSIKTPQQTQGSPSQANKKGLWGGFCAYDDDRRPGALSPPPGAISGLMTPREEPEGNPFEQNFKSPQAKDVIDPEQPLIKTPPAGISRGPSSAELGTIDAVLVSEKDLDEAMELAAKIPGAQSGSVEVRPVMDYEAAGAPQHDTSTASRA